MPTIALPTGYVPMLYPTISGPIAPAPSSPTGGVTTVDHPLVFSQPLTVAPSLTPTSPAAPPPPDCGGCNKGVSGQGVSAVPQGGVTGQPLPSPSAGAAPAAGSGCGCGSLAGVEKFFAGAPVWALILVGVVGGAVLFRGR